MPDVPTDTGTQTPGPGASSRLDLIGPAIVNARLLLSSYAALNLILAARIYNMPLRLAFGTLGVAGFADAIRLVRAGRRKAPKTVSFVGVRDSGDQVAAYLATYLLPLLAAPAPAAGDLVGYGIYAVVVAVITVRSDLIHINPTVYVLGWKIATVTRQDGREQYVVCKKPPPVLKNVPIRQFHGVIRIENNNGNANSR